MIQDVLEFVQKHIERGERVALTTVTEIDGSSPASAGQVMAVLADGTSRGTIGGGITEFEVIKQARQAIKNGEKIFNFSFNHAENGMLCGGVMRGYGNVLGGENHMYIFGGGHIGQCLAQLAAITGFYVTVIEDREEFKSAFPNARYILCQPEDYEKEIKFFGSAYAVVCTRGHKTDDDALRFCLSKTLSYVGMIGSLNKTKSLLERLRQEGYGEALNKVYTPIGLDIASSVPSEIAVAILAEILLVKNNGTLTHKRIGG